MTTAPDPIESLLARATRAERERDELRDALAALVDAAGEFAVDASAQTWHGVRHGGMGDAGPLYRDDAVALNAALDDARALFDRLAVRS